jgi:adenylate kinase
MGKGKRLHIVVFGPPGSGKGTQAELLQVEHRLYHLSTGEIFRDLRGSTSPMADEIEVLVNSGRLVPDDLVGKVVGEKLEAVERDARYAGVLFDGYPRNIAQAKHLDETLGKKGKRIDFVFSLDVPEEELIRRLTGRRVCSRCGRNYNVYSNPPAIEGWCDLCGGELIQRDDDQEKVIAQRLNVYHEQTTPLLKYYEQQGNLFRIQGDRDKQTVFDDIMGVLGRAGSKSPEGAEPASGAEG